MKVFRILIISLFFFNQSYANQEIVTLTYSISEGTAFGLETEQLGESINLSSGDHAKVVRFSQNIGLGNENFYRWRWESADGQNNNVFQQSGYIYVWQNGIRSTAALNDIINGPAVIQVGYPTPIFPDNGRQPSFTARKDNFIVAEILITRAPNPQPAQATTPAN